MKTMRKVFTLFLTMAMCAAMSVTAFAAGTSSESDVITKTYDLGNVIVTVVNSPSEFTPIPLGYDTVIDALASPIARHTFTLESGEGPRCGAHVYNNSSDTRLEASFSFTLGNETASLPSEMVVPGRHVNFNIETVNGEDLVGRTVTTIEAIDSDSVRYTYTIEQQ